jgi:hypothetical protein
MTAQTPNGAAFGRAPRPLITVADTWIAAEGPTKDMTGAKCSDHWWRECKDAVQF